MYILICIVSILVLGILALYGYAKNEQTKSLELSKVSITNEFKSLINQIEKYIHSIQEQIKESDFLLDMRKDNLKYHMEALDEVKEFFEKYYYIIEKYKFEPSNQLFKILVDFATYVDINIKMYYMVNAGFSFWDLPKETQLETTARLKAAKERILSY